MLHKKRTMANKIKISKDIYDDEYEPSDSEEEYTANEKALLKKFRKGRKKNEDDQEVFGFEESASENDDPIENSDFEDDNNYDDIPDSKAWGKKRSAYYNTDFVDQDYSTYNEQEQELAQQEEEEAKAIQQRLAKQLDEADFSLDVFNELPVEDVPEESKKKKKKDTKLKTDLSDMSQRQKLQLFQKDSPEFNGLVQDFKHYSTESENYLLPILEYAKLNKLEHPIIEYAGVLNNLILSYCTNISFYLLLKTKRTPIKHHPVVKRLVQFRQLILQLDEKYNNVVKPQIEKVLEAIESGVEINLEINPVIEPKSKKLNILKSLSKESKSNEELMEQDEDAEAKNNFGNESEGSQGGDDKNEESDDEEKGEDDNEEEADERRGITYQIAKNKGLTPHRKKELRNPRVKHRNKFRKALIRRKGAVRTVRKETQRYAGEVSGIKATVKKGIKLKS